MKYDGLGWFWDGSGREYGGGGAFVAEMLERMNAGKSGRMLTIA